MIKKVKLIITGQVQGVFYRAQTKQKAEYLRITGWVKNEEDGSVLIVATGEEEHLHRLIDWCWDGPEAARVDDIQEEWDEPEEFEGFSIRY